MRRAVCIILLAVLVRVAFAAQLLPTGYWDYPLVDAHTFQRKAQAIAFISWWGERGSYYHEPLYLYVLAVIFRLCGYGLTPAYLFNFACGCGSAALTFALARVLLPSRPRLALAAGVAAAFCGPLLFFEGQLLREPLATLLLLAGFTLFFAQRDRPARPLGFALGLLCGLGAATRGSMLVLLPVIAGYWLVRRPARWAAGLVWLLLGAALVLGPIALRNKLNDDTPVFLASSWGMNLYLGNHPRMDSLLALRPGFGWEQFCLLPQQAGVRPLNTLTRQQYYVAEVERWALSDPPAFLRLQVVKFHRFLHGYELMRNVDPYFVAQQVPVLRLLLWRRGGLSFPTGLIIPFALLGLAVLRPQWRRLAPYLWLLGLYTLSVVAFFVVSRYRAPLLPLLLPAAMAGVAAVCDALRHRAPLLPVAALLLIVLLNADPAGLDRIDYSIAWRQRGDIAVRSGRPAEALRCYQVALDHRPGDPELHNELGAVLRRLGRRAGAEEQFRAALVQLPGFTYAADNLAAVQRERADATALYARWSPALPRAARLALVHTALDAHLPDVARRMLASFATDTDVAAVLALQSECFYQQGDYRRAAQMIPARLAPATPALLLARGWARYGSEDFAAAGRDWADAWRLDPLSPAVRNAVLVGQATGGIFPPLLPDGTGDWPS